jgi:hypothetical protein
MLKKLFVTAAAAAAVSVPLAGAAWADKPADPGAGNQGVPDRATAAVVSILKLNGIPEPAIKLALDGFQSGKSGVVAPGTAYSTGAKTDCPSAGGGTEKCNTPDGYGAALNTIYGAQPPDGFGIPLANVGGPFGRTIPGSVTKQFTNGATQGCKQQSTGTCLD